jgi:hypothetical protein
MASEEQVSEADELCYLRGRRLNPAQSEAELPECEDGALLPPIPILKTMITIIMNHQNQRRPYPNGQTCQFCESLIMDVEGKMNQICDIIRELSDGNKIPSPLLMHSKYLSDISEL